MNKNVLILSSSPRKGGNSNSLCNQFARGCSEAGNLVETIALRDKTIHYCTGCSLCSRYGKPCPQKDDAAAIIQKMVEADVIVMGTPVYFYTMCAQMKALIDRCCGRYTEMSHKRFYLLLAAADEQRDNLRRTVDTFQGFLDCLEQPQLCGVVFGVGAWHVGDILESPAMTEAYEMGKTV